MDYVSNGYVRSGYVIEDSDTIDGITFDKYGLFIEISESISSIDIATIRSRHVDWLDIEENDKIKKGIRYSGFDPIPTGFTGATFFMINGWRLVYNPATTAISGVLFSEDYPTAYWTRVNDVWSPLHPVTVSAVVNTVTVGSGLSAEEHAQLMSLINTDLTVTDGKIDTVKTDTEQILADVDAIPNVVEVDKVAIAREVWSTVLPLTDTQDITYLGEFVTYSGEQVTYSGA